MSNIEGSYYSDHLLKYQNNCSELCFDNIFMILDMQGQTTYMALISTILGVFYYSDRIM